MACVAAHKILPLFATPGISGDCIYKLRGFLYYCTRMNGARLNHAEQTTRRRAKVRDAMRELELDALLIGNLSNIRYLFNFSGSTALALLTLRKAYLIVDSRYISQGQKETVDADVILSTPLSQEAAMVKLIRRLHPSRLGFESRCTTHYLFTYWRSQLRRTAAMIPTHYIVEKVRAVKDSFEIQSIRKALKVTWETFHNFLPMIKPGVREKDLATELEYQLLRNGANKLSFDTIIASGYRSAMPHGKASEKKIGHREFVTIDFGIYLNGYASDMTRTVFVGAPSAEQRRIYNSVREAVEVAETDTRPGLKGAEVDALARRTIHRHGYGSYFGHATGHGIGLDVHEQPFISARGDAPITPNMVFTIEPGVYVPDKGGVRIEDIVAVTASGCEVMTQYPKDLVTL
ncbi:MAG: aminopeptidase P family protein [Acidobacteria bacterium]|nr:aminopeptidase P family protein [Acidobacteriota bacterium]MBI3657991.1 aminopeptidase P family protein [Acidobacteriota bacterium]